MKQATFTNRLRVTVGQASIVGFVAAVLVLSSFLISCAPASDSSGVKPTGYEHLDADEREALSDLYADEGEQKLGFTTLNEAWGKFSEALQVDPQNKRAEFWREMLKPLLEMKGVAARVRPLYLSKPNGRDRYARLMDNLESQSSAEYRTFLRDGPADIGTDAEFREWMDRLIISLDTTRGFLKANQERTYTLRAPVHFIAGALPQFEEGGRCTALKLMDSKFTGCAESGMLKFKLNRADLVVLQYIVASQMLQLAAIYSFNLNPIAILNDDLKPKDVIAMITTGYDGGLLERNRLNLANAIAPDWLTAQQYFIRNQNELCKKGHLSEENRPGFLVSSGVCMNTSPGSHEHATLRMLEMTLSGQPIQLDQTELNEPVSIYPLKFFNQPPKEIIGFMPTAFDENGEPNTYNDTSYSPYFTQGSMSALVRAQLAEKRRLEREAADRRDQNAALQRQIDENNARYQAERNKAERERIENEIGKVLRPASGTAPAPEVPARERR